MGFDSSLGEEEIIGFEEFFEGKNVDERIVIKLMESLSRIFFCIDFPKMREGHGSLSGI